MTEWTIRLVNKFELNPAYIIKVILIPLFETINVQVN